MTFEGKDKDTGAAAAASVINQALSSTEGVLKALLQASMSNPLIGIVTGLTILDVLHTKGVITDTVYTIGVAVITAGAGVSLADQTITALLDVLPFTGSRETGASDIVTPSGSVLVFGDTDMAQLNALLSKLPAPG